MVTAWPASAQRTMLALLGVAITLLGVHTYGFLPWRTRPSTLERFPGPAYRIDLNHADRAELLQLPGVGESLVGRIEDYRREHGGFQTVDDLTRVRGIGPLTLERLRPWVQVSLLTGEEAAPATVRQPPAGDQQPASRKSVGSKQASLTGPIDVNRAPAEELQRLPGIGPKLSQRIVEERSKGPFKSVEELRRVPGIGPKLLERIRPFVIIPSDSLRVAVVEQEGANRQ